MRLSLLLCLLLSLTGATLALQSISNSLNNDAARRSNTINRRDALLTTTATASGLLLPTSSILMNANAAGDSTAVKLSNGDTFPLVSFGLQIYDDEKAYKLTLLALEVGYRNFFASVLAGNQKGFAKAVRDSGIPRESLYICGSVVSNRASGFEDAKKATTKGWQQNMNAFAAGNIDYLDMIMLDYPGPDQDSIRGQWRSFEEMHEQKLTKALAVSNFNPSQLDSVLQDPAMTVKPVVNQLPFGVAYHPGKSVEENKKRGILVQAWAPLGGSLGGKFDSRIMAACSDIGKKHNKSGAQVALRWVIQCGGSVCTQTKKRLHFIEDLEVVDFVLSDEEMVTLSALA